MSANAPDGHRLILCVLAAAAYSLTDEFHQLFVVGRNGTVADVLSIRSALHWQCSWPSDAVYSCRTGKGRNEVWRERPKRLQASRNTTGEVATWFGTAGFTPPS
jgi:hypothetical protein